MGTAHEQKYKYKESAKKELGIRCIKVSDHQIPLISKYYTPVPFSKIDLLLRAIRRASMACFMCCNPSKCGQSALFITSATTFKNSSSFILSV